MSAYSTCPWGPPTERFYFSSVQEFETVLESIRGAILETFRLHPYNTIDSFVNFHRAYRNQKELKLREFHSVYPLEFQGNSKTCVGLSLTVKELISDRLPLLRKHLFLVVSNAYPLETPEPEEAPSDEQALVHEHVLVVLGFCLNERLGYVLVDTGITVDIPVVVMRDGLSPHTGTFRRIARTGYREYRAEFISSRSIYAVWNTKEFRSSTEIVDRRRFVYMEKPFVRPDALERRNLVYHFHGYLPAGLGGIKAGIYFVLGKDNERFSLITPDEKGEFKTVTLPYAFFTNFQGDILSSEEKGDIYKALETFSQICGLEGGNEAAIERFKPLSVACTDIEFIKQVKELNNSCLSILNTTII